MKAGGGCMMSVGEMLRSFLTKLEWFSTLFPRIPVPVQKAIDQHMKSRPRKPPPKDEQEEEEEEVAAADSGRHGDRRRSRYSHCMCVGVLHIIRYQNIFVYLKYLCNRGPYVSHHIVFNHSYWSFSLYLSVSVWFYF